MDGEEDEKKKSCNHFQLLPHRLNLKVNAVVMLLTIYLSSRDSAIANGTWHPIKVKV